MAMSRSGFGHRWERLESTITTCGIPWGLSTVTYISQITFKEYNEKCDIYSMGRVLLELCNLRLSNDFFNKEIPNWLDFVLLNDILVSNTCTWANMLKNESIRRYTC